MGCKYDMHYVSRFGLSTVSFMVAWRNILREWFSHLQAQWLLCIPICSSGFFCMPLYASNCLINCMGEWQAGPLVWICFRHHLVTLGTNHVFHPAFWFSNFHNFCPFSFKHTASNFQSQLILSSCPLLVCLEPWTVIIPPLPLLLPQIFLLL